jgi:hypothetical protein
MHRNKASRIKSAGFSLTQTNEYNGADQRIKKTETAGTNPTDVVNYFYQDGEVLYTTGSDKNKAFYNQISYAGGIYDESTQQYYLNARFYDPEVGQPMTTIRNTSMPRSRAKSDMRRKTSTGYFASLSLKYNIDDNLIKIEYPESSSQVLSFKQNDFNNSTLFFTHEE